MNLKQAFIQSFGEPKILPKGQFMFYCPSCSHRKRKLSINFDKNIGRCWVCSLRSRNLINILKRFNPQIISQIDENIKINSSILYPQPDDLFVPSIDVPLLLPDNLVKMDSNNKVPTINNAYNFLIQRGISDSIIQQYELSFCTEGKYNNRIIIPSYNEDNFMNFFITRTIYDDNSMKYIHCERKKEDVIIFENKINWNLPIILTEGTFDAMKINFNSIPLLGTQLSEDSYLFNRILDENSTVYLSLDNDKAGFEGTIKCAKSLLNFDIKTYFIDLKGYNDPAEIHKKDFLEMMTKSKQIDEFWIMEKEILNA